jgi:hypothetical protein
MAPRFKSSIISAIHGAITTHARFDDERIEPELTKLIEALDTDLFEGGYEPSTVVESVASNFDSTLIEVESEEEEEEEEEETDEPEADEPEKKDGF